MSKERLQFNIKKKNLTHFSLKWKYFLILFQKTGKILITFIRSKLVSVVNFQYLKKP